MEKIASSEGVCSRRLKTPGDEVKQVKGIINKEEMLAPFKKLHPWYFKLDERGRPIQVPKPKTFMEIIYEGVSGSFA